MTVNMILFYRKETMALKQPLIWLCEQVPFSHTHTHTLFSHIKSEYQSPPTPPPAHPDAHTSSGSAGVQIKLIFLFDSDVEHSSDWISERRRGEDTGRGREREK